MHRPVNHRVGELCNRIPQLEEVNLESKLSLPSEPFWKRKALDQLDREEWESLCDGCGRCCLQKLKNKKTGKVHYTCVSCYLLDIHQCHCTFYEHRTRYVLKCLVLTPAKVKKAKWLPKTCAYRLVAESKDLEWWHPLVSGDDRTVHEAGISVRNIALSEEYVHPEQLEDFIISCGF